MFRQAGVVSAAALMAGALALGGCATVESVQHAQETADRAVAQAQASEAAAQKAQTAAEAATASAQAATTAAQQAQATAESGTTAAQAAVGDAQRANNRLDQQTPVVQHLEHHHHHRTFRNVAHKGGHAAHHAAKPQS